MRGVVSRADLVRLIAIDGWTIDEAAEALGYEPPTPAVRRQERSSDGASNAPPDQTIEVDAQPRLEHRHPFIQVTRIEHIEQPERVEHPPSPVPDAIKQRVNLRALPPARPAEPWSDHWPRLFRLLVDVRASAAVDLPETSRRLARARPLVHVLRRTTKVWPERVVIWIDRRSALAPMKPDFEQVIAGLERIIGRDAVRVDRIPARRQTFREVARQVKTVEPAETVIALTDLGRGSSASRFWRGVGEGLKAARINAGALVPGWRAPDPVWRTTAWSTPTALGSLDDQVEALLGLSVVGKWVQPGLLRALRRLLPPETADLGTELAVWRSGKLESATLDGMVLTGPARQALSARWPAIPSTLRKKARELVVAWHRGVSADLAFAETLTWEKLEPKAAPDPETRHFLTELVATLRHSTEPALQPAVRAYTRALLRGMPASLYADPDNGEALQDAWVHAHAGMEVTPPPGVERAAILRGPRGERREVTLSWWQSALRAQAAAGVRLATIMVDDASWRVAIDDQPAEGVAIEQPIALDGVRRVQIESNLMAATLERRKWPDWAVAMGIHRGRTWAEVDTPDGPLRLFWDPTAEVPAWRAADRRVAVDDFGIYEDLTLAGTDVRFRLIPAGTFLMGSPDDEEGRYRDEVPQHEVILTRPFWLADAPTTQALWQAATGENPSRFKGPDRPVERVNWDDAVAFIRQLDPNAQVGLALPTEAQREYACRAGMSAPRYGEPHDVAWYSKNSDGQTHPVRQKQANPWGLYDMLGNVWEWCSDCWKDSYQGAGKVDPVGPLRGASRVIRGGAWNVPARGIHAAYRNARRPGYCNDGLGFRLARGPAASARSSKPGGAGPGRAPSSIEESSRSGAHGPRGSGGAAVAERATEGRRATGAEHDRPMLHSCVPRWAHGLGFDRFGPFVEICVDAETVVMRWIPPGEFMMGAPGDEPGRSSGERHRRERLKQGFWMSETPVTQALWCELFPRNPSQLADPLRPVEHVTWFEAQDFLKALADRLAVQLRLPSELEWERACRAGTCGAIYSGDFYILEPFSAPALHPIAWYGGNSGLDYRLSESRRANWKGKQFSFSKAGTRSVKTRLPNPWGLYDMLGNVWEWCGDHDEKTGDRVTRGGAWNCRARQVRAAYRGLVAPDWRQWIGFRFVIEASGQTTTQQALLQS